MCPCWLARILAFFLSAAVAPPALVPLASSAQNTSTASPPQPDALLVVVRNGKYGYIDHQGRIVIEPQYVWGDDFDGGFAPVYLCGRAVSIDASGKVRPLRVVREGEVYAKSRGGKVGFADASGKFKGPPTFDEALPFSDGLAAVRAGEKWGFVDRTGALVIPLQFSEAYFFHEGVAIVTLDFDHVLINKAGNVIARGLQPLLPMLISEGRITIEEGNKIGFADLQGRVVISPAYDMAYAFSGGFAAVRQDGKWGYIDQRGRLIIPFKFDQAGYFASGLAPAKLGTESGFIDKSGNFAFHLDFDVTPGFRTFNAETDVSQFWTKDQLFGYVNTSGKVIWGPVPESPDHWPLLGWTVKQKERSCAGVSQTLKRAIASYPSFDD